MVRAGQKRVIQTYVSRQRRQRDRGDREGIPLIFFRWRLSPSLTITATRMVEEQRLQIGTPKALGYGMEHCLLWASATPWRAVFTPQAAEAFPGKRGGGEKLLPYVIMTAYFILYENLPVMLDSV